MCRWNFNIGLQTPKEVLYALEEVDDRILARTNIPGSLIGRSTCQEESTQIKDNTHHEKDPNSSKNHLRWREHLRKCELERKRWLDDLECYQADAFANRPRKCKQDVSSRVEPLVGPSVATPGSNEILNVVLFFEHCEDGTRRAAGFELGGESMCEEIFLGLLFIPL